MHISVHIQLYIHMYVYMQLYADLYLYIDIYIYMHIICQVPIETPNVHARHVLFFNHPARHTEHFMIHVLTNRSLLMSVSLDYIVWAAYVFPGKSLKTKSVIKRRLEFLKAVRFGRYLFKRTGSVYFMRRLS